MRILYVLKRFPRLSETFVLSEVLALESSGVVVSIDALLEPEDEPRHPELGELRAAVRHLPRRSRLRDRDARRAHRRVAMRAPLRWLRAARRARRSGTWRRFVQAGLCADRIRTEGIDHVHAHFATAAAEVGRDAAYLAGVTVSVTAHAKDIFHRDNAPQLARRLDGVGTVVTVSASNVAHLQQVLHRDVDIRYIPNGVRLGPLAHGPCDGPILCVSRLVAKKGVDVLIDAFALLAPLRPSTTVEIIGDGPLGDDLCRRAEAAGVSDRVRFLGRQPSSAVAAAYERCSMVVLPCRIDADGDRDGMPTVLVEALARAVPVISTDVVGIPELVRHGITGLLVPPDDPVALCGAVVHLLDDPIGAHRLGLAGRALVASDYDPIRSTDALRAVFARSGGAMRIAVVCSDIGIRVPGTKGAALHLQSISRAFATIGHEVVLCSVAGHGAPPRDIDCRLLPHPGRSEGLRRELRKLRFTERFMRANRATLRDFAPDIVYERLALFGNAGLRIADACGARHVVEVNALLSREEREWRGLRLSRLAEHRERTTLSHADLRVAVSAEVRRHVDGAAPGGRTIVVPNGVERALFATMPGRAGARQRLGLPGDASIVGFTGALRPWHGLDVALHALAGLDRSHHLAVAGDGPLRQQLDVLVDGLGVRDRVHWLGAVPHEAIPTFLAACDVAIAPYPQLDEFVFSPLKLYEYLAAGVPVIASAIGQVPQALGFGAFGALVPPGDPVALADAVRGVRADQRAAQRRATVARTIALEEHTWETRAEAIVRACEEGDRAVAV